MMAATNAMLKSLNSRFIAFPLRAAAQAIVEP